MIRSDTGAIKTIEPNTSVITLDNDQAYRVPTGITPFHLGQKVRVVYDDANGERRVSEVTTA